MTEIPDLHPSRKATWDAFVDRSPQGVIYCKSWWLDAVAPGRYELLTVGNGDDLRAGWPLVWSGTKARRHVAMPTLTQKLGILFAPTQAKYAEQIANQNRLMEELIAGLPPGTSLDQSFHESFTNWLPFCWHGYQQTTRYTYILDELTDTTAIWSGMRSGIRNRIRKAQRAGVRVTDIEDLEYFYSVNVKTFERQGLSPPYNLALVRRIDDACKRHAGRKMLVAEGPDGRAHAGIYIVYDQRCAILLLSGGDEELRSSGAGALSTWEAIRFAATVSKTFDFEGSMIRPIESFYRAFGGRQTPFVRIWGSKVEATQSRPRKVAGRVLRKVARIIDP